MGVAAEELILRPFREVVDRGNEAVANAEAAADAEDAESDVSERMLRAARAVVREGDRALKKIQPIWDGQVEKYGDAFKDAMMDQDGLDKKRRLLEDLLYDFEDYTELDTFDEETYVGVQAATKSFALDVINIIRRLKLEPPRPVNLPTSFPPLPPLPPGHKTNPRVRDSIPPRLRSSASRGSDTRSRVVSPIPASPPLGPTDPYDAPIMGTTRARRGSVRRNDQNGVKVPQRTMTTATKSSTTSSSLLDAYSSPMDDGKPVVDEIDEQLADMNGDLPGNVSHADLSASLPRTSSWVRKHSDLPRRKPPSHLRQRASGETMTTDQSGQLDSPNMSRFDSLTLDSSSRSVSVLDSSSSTPITAGTLTPYTHMSFMSNSNSATSYAPSATASPDSIPDVPGLPDAAAMHGLKHAQQARSQTQRFMSYEDIPTSAPREAPLPPAPPPPAPAPLLRANTSSLPQVNQSPLLPNISETSLPLSSFSTIKPRDDSLRDFAHFEPVPELSPLTLPDLTLPSAAASEYGGSTRSKGADEVATISDQASSFMPSSRQYTRETDCSIGPSSTFRQMQGFCKGAEGFRVGGPSEGIKQVTGFVANRQSSIGRCVGCGYGHNYEEVELDMGKKVEATFNSSGARFRIRLLYKSHVSNTQNNQRQAESFYACLFCVQSGATTREGDATVFTSSDDLLLHLARHPQPLPVVPGVTVVYDRTMEASDPRANDFDLHLPNPPLPSPQPDLVLKTAVATGTKEHRQKYGQKKLPRPERFGGELLQFLEGARIVGVTFPEKWGGKWCLGWHDGKAGAFPAKAAEVEPPRQSEIPMESSSSGMSVTARWKWHPNMDVDGGRGSVWMEFDKGDVISNVRCLYADHWCWSGTHVKTKKTGVFPQSHVLLDTLRQELSSKNGKKSKGLFSGRRPPSSSNSSSLSGGQSGRVSALS